MTTIFIITFLVSIIAEIITILNDRKFSKSIIKKETSGFEISRGILDKYNLNNTYITEKNDFVSNYYDIKRNVVKLSKKVFNSKDIVSISTAAYTTTEVIEKKDITIKTKLIIREFLLLLIMFGYLLLIASLLFSTKKLFYLGTGIEFLILLFEIVTLPKKITVSNRAYNEIKSLKVLSRRELEETQNYLKLYLFQNLATILDILMQILKSIFVFGKSDRE